MIQVFADTGGGIREFLAVMSYYLPRTVAFMWFLPIFSKGYSSPLIKMCIASAIIAYPAYASMEAFTIPDQVPVFTVITFVSEVMLGTLLGITIALPYFAFKAFGALVDVYRGATFSAQVSGGESTEELPLETLFGLLFAALIMAGPGLHALTMHLMGSYLLMPPGSLDLLEFRQWSFSLLRLFADHIMFAVLLSAPVLIAVLVVEIIVEIISAFSQQLQVYSLQFGLRSVFGVGALLILMHFAEEEILTMFREYSESLNQLLQEAK